MNHLIAQFNALILLMRNNLLIVLAMVFALWVIHYINRRLDYRLNYLGIIPRTWHGLIGIPFAPLLHADFNHLFFNSIPLIVFISLLLISGMHLFLCITLLIILICGLLTWGLGRSGIHIGASGVIMGYFGYFLVNAYHQPSVVSILIGIVCIYYFGGLLLSMLPQRGGMSWEGHIFGFVSGVAASYICTTLI